MAPAMTHSFASGDHFSPWPRVHLGRKGLLAELSVFLFLIVPSMALSLFLVQRPSSQTGFTLLAITIMLRDLGLLALVLYFLWRNGESIKRIGWCTASLGRELLLGILLFIPFFYFCGWIESLLVELGVAQTPASAKAFLEPHGVGQIALSVVLVAIVAITEETIFRGYLLLRLSAISRSVVLAVVLSSVIFSTGHGYEGAMGIMMTCLMGMVFAGIYLWRRSLVAPITMHFLQDFIALVVVGALVGQPAKGPPGDVQMPPRELRVVQCLTVNADRIATGQTVADALPGMAHSDLLAGTPDAQSESHPTFLSSLFAGSPNLSNGSKMTSLLHPHRQRRSRARAG